MIERGDVDGEMYQSFSYDIRARHMPELPEVETVCRGLRELFPQPVKIAKIEVRQSQLREKVPSLQALYGESLLEFSRRAKYLLWRTNCYTILSHLGMSGSWRLITDPAQEKKHDHIFIHFENDLRQLVYNDPRRFGLFQFCKNAQLQSSVYLQHLGPEPLDSCRFHADYLFEKSRKKNVAIKVFLMDQKNVVGVGNIYASESLFLAGVNPSRASGRVKKQDFERLVKAVRQVLQKAIRSGGTTLRNFRQAGGSEGYFAQKLQVYDRAGKPCQLCQTPIRHKVLGGRSTYWCSCCQK